MSQGLNKSSNQDANKVASHSLRKELGLHDLIPMQILLVVGLTWAGLAARQGSGHVVYWLLAILMLFLPVAGVVSYCVQIWPLEGGVYQWTKHAIGPFAGFMSAWNFGFWALGAVAVLGIQTATSLSYALGPKAAWMADNHILINSLSVGLFAIILLVNIPGFGTGRWVAHFGTAVTVLVTLLLTVLIFYHPHTSAAHPHVSPQRPFSLALPTVTLLTINLFSKLTFNALTGLEQVAVFAGETRNAAKTIMRSAWIGAPIIAIIFILMSGSMLTYVPADQIDLTGPIPHSEDCLLLRNLRHAAVGRILSCAGRRGRKRMDLRAEDISGGAWSEPRWRGDLLARHSDQGTSRDVLDPEPVTLNGSRASVAAGHR